MVKRIGGRNRKSRDKLKKALKQKGKINITQYFRKFQEGNTVQLILNPSFSEGSFDPKFYGKHGKVVGQRGRCYVVEIVDIAKTKRILTHPVHMRMV